MYWKRVLTIVAVVFVVWWAVDNPVAAGHAVHGLGVLISKIASAGQALVSAA
jgi:hypothetical protein